MNDSIEFQLVTENIASVVDPQLRVVGSVSPYWNFIVVFAAMLIMVFNKQLY